MLCYRVAGIAGVSSPSVLTSRAKHWLSVIYSCEIAPNAFSEGPPRAKYQAEGGKKSPEPSHALRQMLEELERGHGECLSRGLSRETRQPEVLGTRLDVP